MAPEIGCGLPSLSSGMRFDLRCLQLAAIFIVGCTDPSGDDGSTDTDEPGSSGSSTGEPSDPPTPRPDDDDSAATSAGDSESGTDSTGSSDDGESGECTADCASGPPQLAWLTEAAEQQGDGWCQALIDDGAGGAIASFSGVGWDAMLGDLLVVDESGDEIARNGGEGRFFPSLSAREDGVFDWAAIDGTRGLADTSLMDLGGEPLANDVAYIHAMATDGARQGYVVEGYSAFPFLDNCSLRLYGDVELHSPLFQCPEWYGGWRVHFDAQGNAILVLEGDYQIRTFDLAALPVAELTYQWNRIIYDSAVAPDGTVWLVGAVGNATNPAYGGFVAKHAPDLSEQPTWEGLVDRVATERFDAITMQGDAPVVVYRGPEGELQLRGLHPGGDERWSIDIDAEPGTILSRLTVDPEGNLLGCGVRQTGVTNPIGTDMRMPVLAKWIVG